MNDRLTHGEFEQLISLLDRFERNHAAPDMGRAILTDARLIATNVSASLYPNGDPQPGDIIRATIRVPRGYLAEVDPIAFEEGVSTAAAEMAGDQLAEFDDDQYDTSLFSLDANRWAG
jgi:hypothetical protein